MGQTSLFPLQNRNLSHLGRHSTSGKWVTFRARGWGIVGLLVRVTRQAGISGRDLPGMRSVAGVTRSRRMFLILVKFLWMRMAGFAARHGQGFRLSQMAGAAGHGHHGRRGVDRVARDTVERWPVTRTVAKVTENLGVFTFERPGMPGFLTHRGSAPQG